MSNREDRNGQKNQEPNSLIVTRETIGFVLCVLCALALIITLTGSLIFGDIGTAVSSFFFGLFGFMAFAVFLAGIYLSVVLIAGRNFIPTAQMTVWGFVSLAVIALFAHAIGTSSFGDGYGTYLSECYAAGAEGAFGTPFGAVGGIIVYPFLAIATPAGAYILLGLGAGVCLYFFVRSVLIYAGVMQPRSAGREQSRGGESAEGKTPRADAPQSGERYPYASGVGSLAAGDNLSPSYYAPVPEDAQRTEEPPARRAGAAASGSGNSRPSGSRGAEAPEGAYTLEQAYAASGGDAAHSRQQAAAHQPQGTAYQQTSNQQQGAAYQQQAYQPQGTAYQQASNQQQTAAYQQAYQPQGTAYQQAAYQQQGTAYQQPAYQQQGTAYQQPAQGQDPHTLLYPDRPDVRRTVRREEEDASQTAAAGPESYSGPDSNRNILYGNSNPNEYRTRNLIFDETSKYNTRPQPDVSGAQGTAEAGKDGKPAGQAAAPGQTADPAAQGRYRTYNANVFDSYVPADEPVIPTPQYRAETPLTPAAGKPAQKPAQETPMRPKPVQETPVRPKPVQETPVQPKPVQETPLQAKPVQETPLQAKPAQRPAAERAEPKAEEREPVRAAQAPRGGYTASFTPQRYSGKDEERYASISGQAVIRPDDGASEKESGIFDVSADRLAPERPAPSRGSSDAARDAQKPKGRGKGRDLPASPVISEDPEEDKEESVIIDDTPEEAAGIGSGLFSDEDSAEESVIIDDTPPEEPELPVRGRDVPPVRAESAQAPAPQQAEQPKGDAADEKPAEPAKEKPKPKPRVIRDYVRPPLDLFDTYPDTIDIDQAEVEDNKEKIVETLELFGISVTVVRVTVGPSVTRYDIVIPKNVTVRTIEKYKDNLAMALQAGKGVSISPNFAQGTVAIEVPNRKRATVGMRNMLESPDYVNAKPDSLTFCIGKDIEGKAVSGGLAKMTHLLVAGTSGSGKSVFLNEIIISLIMKYSPEELRLILIDPKQVEFAVYDKLPHLMINEIIADPNKVIVTLNWAINEMEHRYTLFAQMTAMGTAVRNIDEYNASVTDRAERLPKIVLIVDELADLMLVAKKDIEDRISRIAAKARAAGIHLVLATQRPSVDVITGVLKSNLSSRFALSVASDVDSRVILDEKGAETLLGNGDMLYKTSSMNTPARVQGAWISGAEISRVCDFIRQNNEAYFDQSASDFINSGGKTDAEGGAGEDGPKEVEPVYIDALRFVVQSGSASISMIQRKCSVGYNKAGKIIEWMELSGYISPFDGAKSRKVLLSEDEFREKYGEL